MNHTQLLDWDSNILGLAVAKILPMSLNTKQLTIVLNELKKQGIKLVYWLVSYQDKQSYQAAEACNGFLVDEKLTFCLNLIDLPVLTYQKDVKIYSAPFANTELEAIALEISHSSRFARDPKLTVAQVEKLYKKWINNACKKIVAKVVLIIKKKSTLAGMAIIDEKCGRADISLLGVAPIYQKQGLGKKLVLAAQYWSRQQGYAISQVVTQKTNLKACRLYEACAYQCEKIEYFYHFWL